jgi:hypothetical protein
MRFLPLFLLFACEEEADLLPGEQLPVVMSTSPEWDSILWWEAEPGYDVAARWARATGQLIIPPDTDRSCSAALIDDDLLITAAHCGGDPGDVRTARFGRFGEGVWSGGIPEAQQRAIRLGIPASVVIDDDPTNDPTLSMFQCTYTTYDPGRDIMFWTCAPNTFTWTEQRRPAGTPEYISRLQVLPGHIWGHLNLALSPPSENADIVLASVNHTCFTDKQLLLSPGRKLSSVSCWGPFSHCFRHDADSMGGSSGGPILERWSGDLFALATGEAPSLWTNEDDYCDYSSASYNIGSYLGPTAATLTAVEPGGGGTPIGPWTSTTWQFGTQGGVPHDFQCPAGMLVAGVVGTTTASPQNYVGNLGFVCVPRRPDSRFRFDRSVVNTGGSVDVGFQVAINQDLNTFLHRVRSTSAASLGEPMMTLCPPGQFLRSVEGFGGQYAYRIDAIHCSDPTDTFQSRVPVFGSTGHIGWWPSGSAQTIGCPAGQLVAGGWIDSDWWTDGFQLRCHTPG